MASITKSSPTYVAADTASATVYVSTRDPDSEEDDVFSVSAFRWDGAALVAEGVVEAAGGSGMSRPLAVVPPAPGQCTSYLVVGILGFANLRVLSLPDRRLVHTLKLEGMQVAGLAADPSGTALAVCEFTSKAIHVLPWPLPGMPLPLQ